MKFASRISELPPYVFASLAQRIAEREARGDKVINFGIGDPDLPMPAPLVETLAAAAHDPRTHRYPNYFGMPALRQAMSWWYGKRFGVDLDWQTEVLPLIGSKEGIAHIALAFCDAEHGALVPNPGYPAYRYGTLFAGGQVYEMPLDAEHGFLPDFATLDPAVCRQAAVMWLNYPNNPTGAVADLAFFERAVAFARQHDLVICHDNPYCDVTFDDYYAPSILQVDGARDCAVEFNSLSKTYNMAGLRIGMLVGNARVVEALGRIKSNIDSGVPTIIQETAAAALTGDQSWIAGRNAVYARRRDRLVAALNAAGLAVSPPQGSLYLWGRTPHGLPSKTFADRLFADAAIVVTPGPSFGSRGEGYFRMSLTVPDADVEVAVARLQALRF